MTMSNQRGKNNKAEKVKSVPESVWSGTHFFSCVKAERVGY